VTGLRIGHGYDVHRLVQGRPLVLGGVEIESKLGLDGWSDADVVLHAISDAVLGALALGDLGEHFPPGDPEFQDANSAHLLRRVLAMITERGYGVVNCDVTVIAERPRLMPYREAIRARIASIMKLDLDAVSFKATTHEGLGSLGRMEGMAAHAVVLLEQGAA
jgi:2-C-methyl-D-erythritol 2,4-cyclodiphosphate synthase